MDLSAILDGLATSGPLAGVLAGALWVVWGRYQAALGKIDEVRDAAIARESTLRDAHESYVRRLADAALQDDHDDRPPRSRDDRRSDPL